MPRTPEAPVKKLEKLDEPVVVRSREHRWRERCNGMDKTELLTVVCKLICRGYKASRIQKELADRYKIVVSREEPYQILALAAKQGWLKFSPPSAHALRESMKREHPWLTGVDVVHTATFDDVAQRGAEMLLELVRTHRAPPYSKDVCHIGFAGGHAMRRVAECFARLLREPAEGLPSTIVFHAMVAGFDLNEPATAPNAFFTYFIHDPAMRIKTRFVGLHAPALVRSKQMTDLKGLPGVREAYVGAKDLDIVVTSASLWGDEHSMLRRYMANSEDSLVALQKAGCLGDMLWRPISRKGPIGMATDIRAMTLVELGDLPGFIARGSHVLLVLGPCGGCGQPKSELLDMVLGLDPRLITHLVVDSRAAREVLERTWTPRAPLPPAVENPPSASEGE